MSQFNISKEMMHTQSQLLAGLSKHTTRYQQALDMCRNDSEALSKIINETRDRIAKGEPDDIHMHALPSGRGVEVDLAGLYLAIANATVDSDINMLKFNVAAEETNSAMTALTKMALEYRAERGDESAIQILTEVEEDIANEKRESGDFPFLDDGDDDESDEEANN